MNEDSSFEHTTANDIDFDISLLEQGLSMPEVLDMLARVKRELDVEIAPATFLREPTMRRLHDLIEQAPAAPAQTGAMPALLSLSAQLLGGAAIDPERDLFEQGLNSLTLLNLIRKANEQFGARIEIEAFLAAPTLRALCELLSPAGTPRPVPQAAAAPAPSSDAAADGAAGLLGIMASKEAKLAFLAQRLNLRPPGAHQLTIPGAALGRDYFSERYAGRMSRRAFGEHPVAREQLLAWLSCLNGVDHDGQPRYLYPSAGSTYSVQVYIEVKPDGINGLAGGCYYYHPLQHCLVKLSDAALPRSVHFFYNRPHYDACGFCLYLVAEYRGIEPIYQKESELFVSVESGAIIQLLLEHQARQRIGSCVLSGVDNAVLGAHLGLERSQHAMLAMAWGALQPQEAPQAVPQAATQHAPQAQLATRPPNCLDIAIVGIHGRFPGADDLDALWDTLCKGQTRFSGPPPGRWCGSEDAHAGAADGERHWAGFLSGHDAFDTALFGIGADEAARMDPQEKAFLSCVMQLLDQSAYSGANLSALGGQVGVFVGAMWNDAQTVSGGAAHTPLSSIANRVSFQFDWSGPSLAIDTSCSSALSAIYLAAQAIRRGDCTAAVAGGVNLIGHPAHLDNLHQFNLLTKARCSDTFGDTASGWIAGEGVGAVLLKRLEDAEADQDHIWGVIRGGSLAGGGKVARYGMPSTEGQAQLMRQALAQAQLGPDAVQYIEAAAAGSAIGDASEMRAIEMVFGGRAQPLLVGSVKSNIGHLESASGISQLAKLLLQMKYRAIPAVVPFGRLNPLIDPASPAATIAADASDWHTAGGSCLALINAFGGTGSYASLLVESAPGRTAAEAEESHARIPAVFVLSAPSEHQLHAYATLWRRFLRVEQDLPSLPRILALLQRGRNALPVRLALPARSAGAVLALLDDFIAGRANPDIMLGRVPASPSSRTPRVPGNDAQALARAWVHGEWEDWANLYPATLVAKLPLPACPSPAAASDALHSAAPRRSIPAPATPTDQADLAAAIRGFLEQRVSALLAQAPDASRAHLSFIERGVTSAGLMTLARGLETAIGTRIAAAAWFDHGSVAELAAYLATRHADAGWQALAVNGPQILPALPALPALNLAPHPLSEGQTGLWILQKTVPHMGAYNCPIAMRLAERITPEQVLAACLLLAQQYPVLSSVIRENDGDVLQVPYGCAQPECAFDDAETLDESALIALLRASARRPFDMGAALWRAHVLHCAGQQTVILLTLHHLIFDGASFLPLTSAFQRILAAQSGGARPALSPAYDVASFVDDEKALMASADGARHLAYWKRRLLDGLDVLKLPTDVARPRAQSYEGDTLRRSLPPALGRRLRQFASEQRSYCSTVFLSAFGLLLSRHGASETLCIGMPVNCRRSDAPALPGYFVDMLPIRLSATPALCYRDYLGATQVSVAEALAHRYPFAALVRELGIRPEAQHAPVFQAAFAYQNFIGDAALDGLHGPAGQPVQFIDAVSQEGEYELLLEVWEHAERFEVALKYNSGMYLPATAARLLDHLELLLAAACDAPGQTLDRHGLLTAQDRCQLQEWNSTAAQLPAGRCLHHYIADQADAFPSRRALQFEASVLTYGELDRHANRLAHLLLRQGAGPGVIIAVCLDRSLDMVVALLAVLKAGAAYVPIDPELPRQRIAFLLEDTGAPLVITEQKYGAAFSVLPPRLHLVDTDRAALDRESTDRPDVACTPDDLAYVIYTSGSTGKPKGCMLSHDAVCNRLWWMQEQYRLGEADLVLQKTPFSFDVSVWEFFWPLMSGAALVLAAPGGHKDPHYLRALIDACGVTTCHFVPSMLAAFLPALRPNQCASLKRLFTSGEALSRTLADQCMDALGPILHNLYGPTEAAVDVSYWAGAARADGRVPIGKPIANVQLHVLGPALEQCAIGLQGELHIGGVCLAQGYLNRPELTAEKFVPDPYSERPGARLYKTGDLARWLPDGNIEYLGRIDQQVKLRGFRIELGEIEARLREHVDIRDNAVNVWTDGDGDQRLVAYVVMHPRAQPGAPGPGSDATSPPDQAAWRDFLAAALPEHMLPSAFVVMDALPLTVSGKLDRKALPSPSAARSQASAYIAPRTPGEIALARIWCTLLGLDRVGIRDDFFALGGHSLKAVTLITRVAAAFGGKQVAQLDFYREPTIAALAVLLDSDAPAPFDPLPLLRKGGAPTALSLICVPYAGASATVFQPFADAFCLRDPGAAVYAVALPGNEYGSRADPDDSILTLAAARADEIAARIPGPLAVYGHCVGSFLALELTRQLEARGRTVEFLGVGAAFPFPKIIRYLPLDDPWRLRSDRAIHGLIRSWGGAAGAIDDGALRFMLANFRKDARLAFMYEKQRRAWTIAAPLYSIVSADDSLTRGYARRYRRWQEVAARVHLVVIEDGQHYFIGNRADLVAEILAARAGIAARPNDPSLFYVRENHADN